MLNFGSEQPKLAQKLVQVAISAGNLATLTSFGSCPSWTHISGGNSLGSPVGQAPGNAQATVVAVEASAATHSEPPTSRTSVSESQI